MPVKIGVHAYCDRCGYYFNEPNEKKYQTIEKKWLQRLKLLKNMEKSGWKVINITTGPHNGYIETLCPECQK